MSLLHQYCLEVGEDENLIKNTVIKAVKSMMVSGEMFEDIPKCYSGLKESEISKIRGTLSL